MNAHRDPTSGTEIPGADDLRRANERHREDLADTVEALATKVDVKSRARDQVQETRDWMAARPGGTPAVLGAVVGVLLLALVVRRWVRR